MAHKNGFPRKAYRRALYWIAKPTKTLKAAGKEIMIVKDYDDDMKPFIPQADIDRAKAQAAEHNAKL